MVTKGVRTSTARKADYNPYLSKNNQEVYLVFLVRLLWSRSYQDCLRRSPITRSGDPLADFQSESKFHVIYVYIHMY